jgi:uroporphyrinogen decarboxylase
MTGQVRSEEEIRRLKQEEKEEIVRRFNERVDTSLQAAGPTKEWVKKALSRRGASRCPVRLRRLSVDIILRYGDPLADLFCAFPDDVAFVQAYDIFVGYQSPDKTDRINPIQAMTEDCRWTDEWGTQWQHAPGGVGASTVSNPLQDWSQLDEYLARHLPDPHAPGRLDGVRPALAQHGQRKYFGGMAHMALFERFHCLRGMERAFADFFLYPREVDRLLGALTDYFLELIGAWGQLSHLDGLFITDDWGTQLSLMISPRMWRQFFAARYRRLCEEAHRLGMQVIFHSCGNVTAIIGDLIDAGVDVLDPIQPETMDLAQVARDYGGKVAFCGGISDQKLAVLTPGQVRDHVRRSIDTLGKNCGNAYLAAPSNVLLPEVPLENLQALFEACHHQ